MSASGMLLANKESSPAARVISALRSAERSFLGPPGGRHWLKDGTYSNRKSVSKERCQVVVRYVIS